MPLLSVSGIQPTYTQSSLVGLVGLVQSVSNAQLCEVVMLQCEPAATHPSSGGQSESATQVCVVVPLQCPPGDAHT